MKILIMCLMFLISFVGCSSLPKGSNQLEKRSGYSALHKMKNPRSQLPPSRKTQRVEEVTVGIRLMKSGDYFHGTKISLVVEDQEWIFKDSILKKIKK